MWLLDLFGDSNPICESSRLLYLTSLCNKAARNTSVCGQLLEQLTQWLMRAGVKTASFYGHPYFLCTLLNFGGQQGLSGNMGRLLAGREAALANSSITGVGITMEGTSANDSLEDLFCLY